MKNITKIIIALFAIVAFSCTQDTVEDRPVIVAGEAPALTAPTAGAIYVLTPANATATAERFTWNSADFGAAVEVTYSVQMDKKGGDFTAAQTHGSVISANQVAVTVEVMNTAALKLNAVPFENADFVVRVVATSGVSTTIISEATTAIVVKPYTTEAPALWVPGAYQSVSGYGSDWTHATAPKLTSSGYGKTDFEGYVYFAVAQDVASNKDLGFKLSDKPNWGGNNYGEGASAGLLTAKDGKNISIIPAGYYWIKADTDPAKLTYSTTAITTMGIIGNGTPGGWDASTPMVYDKDTKKWTVTAVLTDQAAPKDGMKFRANNAWAINYGDTGNDGVLDFDGTNIGTKAGTYLITLDLSNPRKYTYTMVKK
jgi:hypothetical protein